MVHPISEVFQSLREGTVWLESGIVFKSDRPLALLNPGTLFGIGAGGRKYISGPSGHVEIKGDSPDDAWAALIASGSLLFGEAAGVLKASSLLKDDRTSRTCSYFCCVVKDCGELIQIFERLNSSLVVILGCGGIGSQTSMLLSGAGVQRLRLIDNDVVERSNLNRQLFWSLQDVGKLKVDVLREQLLARFPNVFVESIPKVVTEETLEYFIAEANAVLLTADEPLGLTVFAREIARRRKIPLVTTGYMLRQAVASLSYAPLPKSSVAIQWYRGPYPVMPSFGPTNAELAGAASSLLIHALAGLLDLDQPESIGWNHTRFPREYIYG